MDLFTVLSFTIFAATLVTIVLALVSYSAFKLREWRRPRLIDGLQTPNQLRQQRELEPQFFKKYVLPPEENL